MKKDGEKMDVLTLSHMLKNRQKFMKSYFSNIMYNYPFMTLIIHKSFIILQKVSILKLNYIFLSL